MALPRDLRLLAYFVQIARAGSIRRASAQLSLSPAVVSEALSDLEQLVGTTLIKRTTRSMSLTDAGVQFLEHAAAAIDAADQALSSVYNAGQRPKGRVRISLPVELSVSWLPRLLRDFEKNYPDVRVEVLADDGIVPLQTSDIDLALRTTVSHDRIAADDICVCEHLVLVCKPDLLTSKTEPLEKRLRRVGLIGTTASHRELRQITAYPISTSKTQAIEPVEIEAPCQFVVNNHIVAHRLALEGFGAALLISLSVQDDLRDGRLASVDDRYAFGFVVARVVARDRYPSAAVRAFAAFLRQGKGIKPSGALST